MYQFLKKWLLFALFVYILYVVLENLEQHGLMGLLRFHIEDL